MRALLSFGFASLLLSPFFALAQIAEITPEELYAGGPEAPTILSSTHPDPDRWYKSGPVEFSWDLPSDITAIAADIFISSGREPMQPYRPAVDTLSFTAEDLSEGINYLVVQFRNFDKWGMIAERTIKIDDTAPSVPVIDVSQFDKEGGMLVKLTASDQLSGLSHFELAFGDRQSKRLDVAEASRGHLLTLTPGQSSRLQVTAYDQAGNSSEASLIVWPTSYNASSIAATMADEPASFLVTLLTFLLTLMFGYLIYERLRYARALAALRKETADVHNQMIRIFTALREEIYDQIRGISKKSRLSKGEKQAVDGLNQALAVSESLLEKEVKDVKKLLAP
ncbi:hypothetical protein A2837_01135 [Candidatus Kaiserbacteria bacterium RIFCSPHIGHO2_01_FULL_46_22]|uniref:Uncharacterized protein n=1 Tax=Candidatus Kaiserbacteria bacterium RIFCSPHIGHO2_01_FULL_46_22 TaxID=1798475 RepID=A0A1F6BY13_9BACT|nr:MAG: hypothetical protein A2837_01135 [Candidatus Kaiserbacteria bacterium RIFCSPHIGHO2_01_FULL_46_22]